MGGIQLDFFDRLFQVGGIPILLGFITFLAFSVVFGFNPTDSFKLRIASFLTGERSNADWADVFLSKFDEIYSPKMWSWKRLKSSAFSSLISVFVLFILFDGNFLNILGKRAVDDLTIYSVVIFGVILNLVPDFFSIAQTRWVIRTISKTKRFSWQVLLLLIDLLFTMLVILVPLIIFQRIAYRVPVSINSALEPIASYRSTSIFFYSTFLTSLSAWIFWISSLTIRLISGTFLKNTLDIKGRPFLTMGVIGSVIVTSFSLVSGALIKDSPIGNFDQFACNMDWRSCEHGKRIATNDEALNYFDSQICLGSGGELGDSCLPSIGDKATFKTYASIKEGVVMCENGDGAMCNNLGLAYGDPEKHGLDGYLVQDISLEEYFFKRGCEHRNSFSCVNIGRHYMYDAETLSAEKAQEYLRKTCDPSSGGGLNKQEALSSVDRGCYLLGLIHSNGALLTPDFIKANTYFAASCWNFESGQGCLELGLNLLLGRGVKKDNNLALTVFNVGCDGFTIDNCAHKANLLFYHDDDVENDIQEAIKLARNACDLKSGLGCKIVAHATMMGDGLPKDVSKGLDLALQSCEAGHYESCYLLGSLFTIGNIFPRDLKDGADYFDFGCDLGDFNSCNSLGLAFEHGRGRPKDRNKAIEIYDKSCSLSNARACVFASIIIQGSGIRTENFHSKLHYLKRSCDFRDMVGCAELGEYLVSSGESLQIQEGKELLEYWCSKEKGEACYVFGRQHLIGEGLEKDIIQGVALYKKACNLDTGLACRNLGNTFANGQEIKRNDDIVADMAKANVYYKRGCDLDDNVSCNSLGISYLEGRGTEKDVPKAMSLYEKACKLWDYNACNNLGNTYNNGQKVENNDNIVKDASKAATYYELGCDVENGESCNSLGVAYLTGKGVEKNVQRALLFYEKSCDLKNYYACNNLGNIYNNGREVDGGTNILSDKLKAFSFYERGCEIKNSNSCRSLGRAYLNGDGVDKKIPEAIRMYTKACDLESSLACYNLADLYQNGIKGESVESFVLDKSKAFDFYIKGCDLKYTNACDAAGYMAFSGEGMKLDKNKAIEIYKKACGLGSLRGCYNQAAVLDDLPNAKEKAEEFLSLYERTCDEGYALGCSGLASLYFRGEFIKKDLVKAMELYEMACELGNEIGCSSYRFRYWMGDAVKEDKDRAFQHAKTKCEKEDMLACVDAGYFLDKGWETQEPDYERAYQFYLKACDKASSKGCHNLGLLYKSGDGVVKNVTEARLYFTKACDLNNKKSCAQLDELSEAEP